MLGRKSCHVCRSDIPDGESAFELKTAKAKYLCQRCMRALIHLWHEEHKVSELIVDEEHKFSELIVEAELGLLGRR